MSFDLTNEEIQADEVNIFKERATAFIAKRCTKVDLTKLKNELNQSETEYLNQSGQQQKSYNDLINELERKAKDNKAKDNKDSVTPEKTNNYHEAINNLCQMLKRQRDEKKRPPKLYFKQ